MFLAISGEVLLVVSGLSISGCKCTRFYWLYGAKVFLVVSGQNVSGYELPLFF